MAIRRLGRRKADGPRGEAQGSEGDGSQRSPEEQKPDGAASQKEAMAESDQEALMAGLMAALLGGAEEESQDGSRGKQSPAPGGADGGVPSVPNWALGEEFGSNQLRRASREVLTALHQAKQELAGEVEANLRQLKAVLTETERITRDLEAVLREARAEPREEQRKMADAADDQAKGAQPQAGGRPRAEPEPWQPPPDAFPPDEEAQSPH